MRIRLVPLFVVFMLLVALGLAAPRPASAQGGEARCTQIGFYTRGTVYILRTPTSTGRTVLRKLDPASVLEIAKGNEICAATPAETCTWLGSLRRSELQILTDTANRVEELRKAVRANQQLWSDIQTLQDKLDQIYDKSESNIKNAIKFSLLLVTAGATVKEGVWEASKDYLFSTAINQDLISFGADASLIVKDLNENGVRVTVRELRTLAINEAIAMIGADLIAGRWIKPINDRLSNILQGAAADRRNAVQKLVQELEAVQILGATVHRLVGRETARVSSYASSIGASCAIPARGPSSTRSDSRGTVHQALWVGNEVAELSRAGDYTQVALLAYLNQRLRSEGPSERLLGDIRTMKAKLETLAQVDSGPQRDIAGFLQAGLVIAEGDASTAGFKRELVSWVNAGSTLVDPAQAVLAQAQPGLLRSRLDAFAAEKLEEAYRLGRASNGVRDLVDEIIGPGLADTAENLLDRSAFANSPTRAVIQSVLTNGLDALSLDGIIPAFRAEMQRAHGVSDDTLRRVREGQAPVSRVGELADLAGSAHALSLIIAPFDPELARHVQIVSRATVQVVKAIDAFANALDGGNFGAALLTGNILGAVTSLFSVFDSGPSPEELILQEIQALRRDVQELRREMNDRFDRVDASLNSIYEQMNRQFAAVSAQLDYLRGDIKQVQQSLLELSVAVTRLESNVFQYVTALGQRNLNLDTVACLNRDRLRGRGFAFTQGEFDACVDRFFSHATFNSRDVLATGGPNRDYSDTALSTELERLPVEANINFLIQFVVRRFADTGLETFATGRVPNPLEWSLGSEGVLTLAVQQPDMFAGRTSEGIDLMLASSDEILAMSRGVAVRSSADGQQVGNMPLFENLLSYYTEKNAALIQQIRDAQNRYRSSSVFGYDPWKGREQPSTVTLTPAQVPSPFPCTGATPHRGDFRLELPPEALPLIPNQVHMARHIGLGEVQTCFTAEYTDVIDEKGEHEECCGFDGPIPFHRKRGRLTVHVQIRLQGINDPVAVLTIKYNELEQFYYSSALGGTITPEPQTPYFWLDRKGPASYGPMLSKAAVTEGLGFAEMTRRLDEYFKSHRAMMLRDVARDMQAGTLEPWARQLNGSKALLLSFIRLGLPKSLAGDDNLRELLLGQRGLPDATGVRNAYIEALELVQSGKDLLADVSLEENVPEGSRTPVVSASRATQALRKYLATAVEAIAAWRDTQRYDVVENVRERLLSLRASGGTTARQTAPSTPIPVAPSAATTWSERSSVGVTVSAGAYRRLSGVVFAAFEGGASFFSKDDQRSVFGQVGVHRVRDGFALGTGLGVVHLRGGDAEAETGAFPWVQVSFLGAKRVWIETQARYVPTLTDRRGFEVNVGLRWNPIWDGR